ncbi:MAG: acetate--CoA ligase family protein [Rhodospirillales bacterium]|nr:acetate--CoA ligase family protein [Rhodospirillales bacterium]
MEASFAGRFAGLTPLLRPRSVAVLGASADRLRIGGRPIAYMLDRGFGGAILPVNPNRSEIQGLRCYASLVELPERPDVAIVAVAAERAVAAVEELAAAGVRGAIVLTAGFAETGAEGAAAQTRMREVARASGMRLLGPNCLGLFNAPIGYFPIFSASFEGGWPLPGRIGIASQSGAFGTHLFVVARDRGIGTPVCITTGNEADVTIADAIGWMAQDEGIDVIAAYAEGFRDGDVLRAALAAAKEARKPVVMMKVGRSALGQAAASSHTAAIAADDRVAEAVLAEYGVARAASTEELLDIAYLATRRLYPAASTLGVLTVSGGGGVLIADAAEANGIAMPPMPAAAQARLRALIPFCAPANPVDCTAQVFNDLATVGTFLEETVAGGYTTLLIFFSQVGGAPSIAPRLHDHLAALRARHPDVLMVLSILAPSPLVAQYEALGYAVFADPTRAVVAIGAVGRIGAAFAAPPPAPAPALPAFALPAEHLSEPAAKQLLRRVGIAVSAEEVCQTEAQAEAAARQIGWPVVMKIVSPDIAHKSEIGGVVTGITSPGDVVRTHALLLERAAARAPHARIDGILVARHHSGVELIMGLARDPVFGPVAMVGAGGIFAEIMDDVALRSCPFGADTAQAMIRSLRCFALLNGARGRERADLGALAMMLARLSALGAAAGPRLLAVDLNPVIASADEAVAVDAVIVLRE